MIVKNEQSIQRIGNFEEFEYEATAENMGTLFHIVRNQLYSDKLAAIVREYSTNAADAHLEIDQKKPFEVSLPTALDPYLRIRDFGPGLSFHGLTKHYVSMGASSKRTSALLNGCMGIGCKAGFAYTDSFSIISNHENMHIEATCYIDETRKGKIAITEKRNILPEEVHGLEILIPIREDDFSDLETKARQVLSAFEFPPLLKRGEKETPIVSKVTGQPLRVDLASSRTSEHYIYSGNVRYPLNPAEVGIPCENREITLEMPLGSFSFSASRESVEYIGDSKLNIKAFYDQAVADILQRAEVALNPWSSSWTAMVALLRSQRRNRGSTNIPGIENVEHLSYRGITVPKKSYLGHLETIQWRVSDYPLEGWRTGTRTFLPAKKCLVVFPVGLDTVRISPRRQKINPKRCEWAKPIFEKAQKEGFHTVFFVPHQKDWAYTEENIQSMASYIAPKDCIALMPMPPKKTRDAYTYSNVRSYKTPKEKKIPILLETSATLDSNLVIPNSDPLQPPIPIRRHFSTNTKKHWKWWKTIKNINTSQPPRLLVEPRSYGHNYHRRDTTFAKKIASYFGENVLVLEHNQPGGFDDEAIKAFLLENGFEWVDDVLKEHLPHNLVCHHDRLIALVDNLGPELCKKHKLLTGLYTLEDQNYEKQRPETSWVPQEHRDREAKLWDKLKKKYPLLTHIALDKVPQNDLKTYLKIS